MNDFILVPFCLKMKYSKIKGNFTIYNKLKRLNTYEIKILGFYKENIYKVIM